MEGLDFNDFVKLVTSSSQQSKDLVALLEDLQEEKRQQGDYSPAYLSKLDKFIIEFYNLHMRGTYCPY